MWNVSRLRGVAQPFDQDRSLLVRCYARMSVILKLVPVIAIVLLLSGCGNRGRQADATGPGTGSSAATAAGASATGTPEPSGAVRSTLAAGEAPRTPTSITIPPQTPTSGNAPRKPEPAAGNAQFSGREGSYLLQNGLSDRIVPTAPDIGRLQDEYSGGADMRAQYAVVQTFMKALSEGRIDTATLLPEHSGYIERSLQDEVTQGDVPKGWYIGTINVDQNRQSAAHLRIEMSRDGETVHGDMFLEKSSGSWYIGDVQVDLAQLGAKPDNTSPRRIEPGLPSWMVDNPINGK